MTHTHIAMLVFLVLGCRDFYLFYRGMVSVKQMSRFTAKMTGNVGPQIMERVQEDLTKNAMQHGLAGALSLIGIGLLDGWFL